MTEQQQNLQAIGRQWKHQYEYVDGEESMGYPVTRQEMLVVIDAIMDLVGGSAHPEYTPGDDQE